MTRSIAALFVITTTAACFPATAHQDGTDGGGEADGGGVDAGLDAPVVYADFPAAPIVGEGLPADIAARFGASTGGGGPCLLEPAIGALIPNNFASPVWEWPIGLIDDSGEAPGNRVEVIELRVHVDNQQHDLVAYTTRGDFTIPEAIWEAVRTHSAGRALEVTVRGATLQGGAIVAGPLDGTRGAVRIAPVAAPGSIVYWTTTGESALKGFAIGDTAVVTVLTPEMMGLPEGHCIGCHTSTPDGAWAVATYQGPRGGGGGFALDVRSVDGLGTRAGPGVATAYALALLDRGNQTMPTMSPARYGAGAAVVVSVLEAPDGSPDELVYTDLRATAGGTGTIARGGDRRSAGTPAFSHDGTRVAYVSADVIADGYPYQGGESDVMVVPFGDGAGGVATPLAGASTPGVAEFYPAFSPDDALIAFNRSSNLLAYHEPSSEVLVVAAGGGTPRRLAANDPPTCSGVTSPGITNSWPRWAPDVEVDGDDRYYWLTFSSVRHGASGIPQLYVAGVRARASAGGLVIEETYPAVYVPNQPRDESNHTPAWDRFQVVVP